MSFVYSLLTEELSYEIALHGHVPKDTVDKKRKQLRALLNRKESSVAEKLKSGYSFDDDVLGVQNSLQDLKNKVQSFDPSASDSETNRIKHRLQHVSLRIGRIKPEKKEEESQLSLLDSELLDIEGEFLCKLDQTTSVPPPSISALAISPQVPSFPSSKASVPVYKWNLKFSGQLKDNLVQFLERVHELKTSRNVSERELFDSAIDLFEEKALIWYRSIRSSVTDWPSLELKLKETFLPLFYDDDLIQEIKQRTQGEKEPAALYIAVMQGLFGRLSVLPPLSEQLTLIMKNLHPYFLSHLALLKIEDIPTLISTCKRLEECKYRIQSYQPPPSCKVQTLLAPDLACQDSEMQERLNKVHLTEVNLSELSCWNCTRTGHTYSQCTTPLARFCFGCGQKNVTKFSCPSCNTKFLRSDSSPKNDQRARMSAASQTFPSRSNTNLAQEIQPPLPNTGAVPKKRASGQLPRDK